MRMNKEVVAEQEKEKLATPLYMNEESLSTNDSNCYHVRITRKGERRSNDLLELDLDKSSLLENIVTQYHQRQPFYCDGTVVDPFDVEKIRINCTERPSSQLLPIIDEKEKKKLG